METIRLTGPDAVLSAIAVMVGFHPCESLVLVCTAESGRLGPAVRADLADADPAGERRDELVAQLVGVADRYADTAQVVVYSDNPDREAVAHVVGAIAARVTCNTVIYTGNAAVDVDPALHAAAVGNGRAVLGGRDELAASVGHHPGAAAPDGYQTVIEAMGTIRGRDEYLMEHMPEPDSVPELIAVAQATSDANPATANLCAVLAAIAYRYGNGALARVALDRAHQIDPDHRLTILLNAAISGGLPPEHLDQMARF